MKVTFKGWAPNIKKALDVGRDMTLADALCDFCCEKIRKDCEKQISEGEHFGCFEKCSPVEIIVEFRRPKKKQPRRRGKK